MRRAFRWQLSAVLLVAGLATAATAPNSDQNNQPPGISPGAGTTATAASERSTTSAALKQGVTITGQAPNATQPLPKLPPDEFSKCARPRMGLANPDADAPDIDMSEMAEMSMTTWLCESKLKGEMQVVIEACLNRSGNTAPPGIIQACTESLDHKLLESDQRFFLVEIGRAHV